MLEWKVSEMVEKDREISNSISPLSNDVASKSNGADITPLHGPTLEGPQGEVNKVPIAFVMGPGDNFTQVANSKGGIVHVQPKKSGQYTKGKDGCKGTKGIAKKKKKKQRHLRIWWWKFKKRSLRGNLKAGLILRHQGQKRKSSWMMLCLWERCLRINLDRRRLLGNPAGHNEYFKLELSGAWEPCTINALKKLVQAEAPNLAFLMETKLPLKSMKRMSNIKHSLGLTQGLVVPSEGRSGGIALLWKSETNVHIQSFSRWHIDAVIDSGSCTGKWCLTSFYGNLDIGGRPESWARLSQLATMNNLPWMCVGDFNEILNVTEKQGGSDRPSRQIAKFPALYRYLWVERNWICRFMVYVEYV